MENNNKRNTIAWIIRIIIFILFVVSAVAKMFPLWAFEKQLVDLGICDWCLSHYLARFIIGFELALGIAILLPHLLKKLVIPVTIGLLVAFCGHLIIQMIEYGAMNGNCGCFGQLIPMTPLEAFIKNVITIGLLIWLYKLLPKKEEPLKDIIYPMAIFLGSALLMFAAFPFTPCSKEKKIIPNDISYDIDTTLYEGTNMPDSFIDGTTTMAISPEQTNDIAAAESKNSKKTDTAKTRTLNSTAVQKTAGDNTTNTETFSQPVEKGPTPKTSPFSQFANFNGRKVKIDEGKKVICLFAPGCDHCQNTAKAIGELDKSGDIPEVYIYFMDEEAEKIPEFFKIAGVKYPYQVLSIGNFWDLLGNGSTPGVICLWNGNVMQSYEGIDKNEFNLAKFKKFALPK